MIISDRKLNKNFNYTITNKQLDSLRLQGDNVIDFWIEHLFSNSNKPYYLFKDLGSFKLSNDLLDDQHISKLLNSIEIELSEIPIGELDRALKFYFYNEASIFLCLGFYSLPFCYLASNGVKSLYFSERLRKDAGKRLQETGLFVYECFKKKNWKDRKRIAEVILSVRLIHAINRYHLNNHKEWHNQWGIPINQEDMLGTNLAFSLIVLNGLKTLDIPYSIKDANAFFNVWTKIGVGLGIPSEFQPKNLKEAHYLARVIAQRQFSQSHEGILLTSKLIDSIVKQSEGAFSYNDVYYFMRKLLGNKYADILEIPHPPSYPTLKWQAIKASSAVSSIFKLKAPSPLQNIN